MDNSYLNSKFFQYCVFPLVVIAITAGIGWNITVAADLSTLKEKAVQQKRIQQNVEKLKDDVQDIKVFTARMEAKQEAIVETLQVILQELRRR